MTPLSAARFRMFAVLLTRFGLASTFLSGVADRFGAWGRHGAPNVSWGDMHHFAARAQAIFPQASPALALFAAWVATVLDTAFGLGLLIGVRTRTMAFGSGVLLLAYTFAAALSPGPHAVFAYGLPGLAGASMLLAALSDDL
jgi:putative oxidoreductase